MKKINLAANKMPSNSKFGWFFSFIFLALAAYFYFKKGGGIASLVFIGLSVAFSIITVIVPALLAPLNRLWFKLGFFLGKIVSPIVLGMMFFLIITPVALVIRMFGRDVLRIKARNVESYWIDRDPVGPPPESFKNQF